MMLFTIAGAFLGIISAFLITNLAHITNDVTATLIGVGCGLAFTSLGIFMDRISS